MSESNPNLRLEAFCDGVFAIALTLLIIDIKIPATEHINTTADFWLALEHIAPSVFTFLLSFFVIFITWVNHHHNLRLINRSSTKFIYMNGFFLLVIVFLPFPTSLLGEHLFTDHAAPAVILYEIVLAVQSIGWILVCSAAVKDHLAKNDYAAAKLRQNRNFGYYASILYSLFAIAAIWFPLVIAIITTLIWLFWLAYGMRLKEE